MENFILEATDRTPKIDFNLDNGELLISGRSIPENSIGFYQPVLEWLDKYINQPCEQTSISIKLEYFNTSSSKCLLDIFKKLETAFKRGAEVTVKWFFEEDDEDMIEAGEDYQSIIKIPFEMIEEK